MTAQERWGRHVAAWSSSGLSCKDYAAKAGVNSRTLTWWKSKLRSAGDAEAAVATSFVEVTEQIVTTAPPVGMITSALDHGIALIRGHRHLERWTRRENCGLKLLKHG